MKVVRLEVSNFKRLRAVEVIPDADGNLVIVSGQNANGKSSLLDSIVAALAGPSATRLISRPIRDGEDEAHVTVDLGDFTVTRNWTKDKSVLKVMSKDGSKYSSPQSFLDEKLGALSFDPLTFTQLKPKEQVETLLGLVELGFDPQELAGRRQAVFDERTEVNRQVKALEGALSGLERPQDDSERETSAADAVEAYSGAQALHAAYGAQWADIQSTEERIRHLKEELERVQGDLANSHAKLQAMGDLPDLDQLKADLDTVEERNAKVRERNAAGLKFKELDSARAISIGMTNKLAQIDAEKAEALAAAKMPIDQLGFDDEGLTYRDVPFTQASAAEQLRVSIAIAMAANPTIRVLRVTDGSLLDSANMKLLEEMCQEHDFQCWVERVSDKDGLGFQIEDGEVV
jgi:DNA repair exonuclease SbcCD ATPase subunit